MTCLQVHGRTEEKRALCVRRDAIRGSDINHRCRPSRSSVRPQTPLCLVLARIQADMDYLDCGATVDNLAAC